MITLTQIQATSKAHQQTGVNLITCTMDIEKQAGVLHKRLEKINYKLDNLSLKADKRQQLEEEVDTITEQLKAFEQ